MFWYLKCYLQKTNVRFYLKVIFHFSFFLNQMIKLVLPPPLHLNLLCDGGSSI